MRILAVLSLVAFTSPVSAMTARIVGDQLILSGAVVSDDYQQVVGALDANPSIHTVILRNSPGGDAPTATRWATCSVNGM
jgi:ClpP class serine protease